MFMLLSIQMDPHENKQPFEKDSGSKWSTFTIPRTNDQGDPVIEKIGSYHYDEATSITGSALRRDAEIQAGSIYPPVNDIDMVDAVVVDSRAEGRYAYFRFRPGSADCYHIVINEEGAVANVGQNIPLGLLDLDIPQGGVVALAITSKARLHENNKPEGVANTELVDLLDTCREAAEPIEPEVLGRKKGFGAAIIRRLTGR
jgi:hypothetical protein